MAFTSTVALKINIVKNSSVITMQFNQRMLVRDVCQLIFDKISDYHKGEPSESGLLKPFKDSTKGHWLDLERTLEYYDIKSGDMLLYTNKFRPLRVRTLDGSVKTLLINQSQIVAELTRAICEKIGLHNPEEFSLTTEEEIPEKLLQRTGYKLRNQKKLDDLKKKLHTDDELNWLNVDKTLCEQGLEESAVLTLRKKYFFSDQNVHSNDPVQLSLLYVQLKDSIINGTHPCTRNESVQLAALQCQIIHGNYNCTSHKPGFLELHEFLPCHYIKLKGIEKSIFAEHRKLHNLSEVNAKFRYVQFCRSLRTYGVTFFLVKEKLRYRSKLVPRLLGISRDSVMRVNEKTKEILKTWPVYTIKSWAATPTSFVLDFGAYSKCTYSVQTTEGEAICCLISGYIEIITRKTSFQPDLPKKEEYTAIISPGDQEKTVRASQIKKKVVQQQESKSERLQLESSLTRYSESCIPRPQQRRIAYLGPQEIRYDPKAASRDEDYEQIKKKQSQHRRNSQEYKHMMDEEDYMTLIATHPKISGAHDYQSLQSRDRSLSEPDYDSISSSENSYQPLLLGNMKDITKSHDSLYQALFCCPDSQAKKP